jgi:hypothetical protein
VTVDDDIRVYTGHGDDLISVIGVSVGDSVSVRTRRGNDTVRIGGALEQQPATVRNVMVDTGSGDDLVGLSNLNVLNIVTLDSVSTVLGPSIAVEVVGAGVVLNGEVEVVITDVFASTSAT